MGGDSKPVSPRPGASSAVYEPVKENISGPEIAPLNTPEKIPSQMLYARLKGLQDKSASQLKMVIEKWFKENSQETGAPLTGAGLVDPVLKQFVKNNYCRTSNEEWAPDSNEALIQNEARKKLFLKEPLYSVEEQKIFLKNEFAIAAALEGQDEKSIIAFVYEHMDPKDLESSGNKVPSASVEKINSYVKDQIEKGDTVMLASMLEEFDGQMKNIDDFIQQLEDRIGQTPNHGDPSSEESEIDSSDSDVVSKNNFKKRILELRNQRVAVEQGVAAIEAFLANKAITDAATLQAANPGQ